MTACWLILGFIVLPALIGLIIRLNRAGRTLGEQRARLGFRCEQCGYTREKLARDTVVCPECGAMLPPIDPRYDPEAIREAAQDE